MSRLELRSGREVLRRIGVVSSTAIASLVLLLPIVARAAVPSPGDDAPTDPSVVDNSGAARFRVPIEVPPGPGGFAPSLELAYSSRAGDGLIGIGWNLSIPEIHCSGRLGVQDLATCTEFEFNGQLLVRDGTSDFYHTLIESFQRIKRVGAGWTVSQPNGTTLYFGETAPYRVSEDGNTARWLLQRMEDSFGNPIHFTYDTATDAGSAYPKRITYGFGATASGGPREIEFVYELRSDPRVVFTGGLRRVMTKRLREVRVYGHTQIARRYELEYESSVTFATDRSRLLSVQEFGNDCTYHAGTDSYDGCTGLPKTTLSYRKTPWGNPNVAGSEWDGSSANDAYRFSLGRYPFNPNDPVADYPSTLNGRIPQLIGDLNGDGLPDRIELAPRLETIAFDRPAEVRIWINTGSGFHGPSDESEWGAQAAAFMQSFNSLQYDRPRINYKQIPVPAAGSQLIPWALYTHAEEPPIASYYAICDAFPTTEPGVRLADDLRVWGLRVSASNPNGLVNASVGNPVTGVLDPHPTAKLVDLDSDGLADLVISVQLRGVESHFACNNGAVISPPQVLQPSSMTVVFRNTGVVQNELGDWEGGWTGGSASPDTQAQALENGLPALEEVIVRSNYAAALEVPAPQGYPEPYSACANLGVFGFERHRYALNLGTRSSVCYVPFDTAPQFHDFDGDGFPDIALLERNQPDLLTSALGRIQPIRTVVWLQKPDAPAGSPRWVRASQYDLPSSATQINPPANLSHVQVLPSGTFQCSSSHELFPYCAPETMTRDRGVRFADVNRDGLTDVVWSVVWDTGGGGSSAGVLLNTGGIGPGTSSAWCASNTQMQVSACVEDAERYIPPAPIALPLRSPGQLADINGDGWLDFVSIDLSNRQYVTDTIWLFDHGQGGPSNSYWRHDIRFDLPIDWGREIPYPLPGLPRTCKAGDFEAPWPDTSACQISPYDFHQFLPSFQAFDLNGDGSADIVSDIQVSLSKSRHSDLLLAIKNGRGGTVDLEYASAIQQRDDTLEDVARVDAEDLGDGIGTPSWRPTPVVSHVRVTGKGFAPSETSYKYARPLFSPRLRSDQGFRLVRSIRPNGSRADEFFYQDHGRAGRTSKQQIFDGAQLAHESEATWFHPGTITGSIDGVFHARLISDERTNWHPGGQGARVTRSITYDDDYGYDFVNQIETTRPTGTVREQREPVDFGSGPYIVGRIARRTLLDDVDGRVLRDTQYGYVDLINNEPSGTKIGSLHELVIDRGTNGNRWVETLYGYDEQGNLIEELAPSPTGSGAAQTRHCYDGDTVGWCSSPEGHSSHSVRVTTVDPLVNVTHQVPDLARGTIVAVDSTFTDEPDVRIALDEYGRTEEEFVTPEGGTEIRIARNFYDDVQGEPLRIKRWDYTAIGQSDEDAIYSASVFGSYGDLWKEIRETTPTGHVATASYRDIAQRITRTTLPQSCASLVCDNVTGAAAEPQARVVEFDKLGRPIRVATPDGVSVLSYLATSSNGIQFDGVLETNGNGDRIGRAFDGNRIGWVAECHGGGSECGSPDFTYYTYEPTGEIRTIQDPEANILSYDYDTLGRAVRIHDPNLTGTGMTQTLYNDAGMVSVVSNARNQTRAFEYDDLGRLVHVEASENGEDDYTITYPLNQLQRHSDWSQSYLRVRRYDALGRVRQTETRIKVGMVGVGEAYYLDFEHDLAGRITEVMYPESTIVRYEYEGAYLKRICDLGTATDCSASGVTSYVSDVSYDPLGRRVDTMMKPGVRSFEYVGNTPRLESDEFDSSGSNYSFMRSYSGFDGLGNATQIDTTSSNPAVSFTETFNFDARNRIDSWSKTGSTPLPYGYDTLGNLTLHAGQPQVFDAARPHAIQQRDGTVYSHDADGNVTSIVGGSAPRHFGFDSANQLVCVDSSAGGNCLLGHVYYDVDGRRVAGGRPEDLDYTVYVEDGVRVDRGVVAEFQFEIEAFGERIALKRSMDVLRQAELVPGFKWLPELPLAVGGVLGIAGLLAWAIRSGVPVLVLRRPGYAGISALLVVVIGLGPVPPVSAGGGSYSHIHWELADPLGSGNVMVLDNGSLLVHRSFTPFGTPSVVAGNGDWLPTHFGGHLWEEDAGLYYMQARWYDAKSGTFLSIDPLVANAGDPQSYNAYSYARNNPASYVDPTGMACFNTIFGALCIEDGGYWNWHGGDYGGWTDWGSGGQVASFELAQAGDGISPGSNIGVQENPTGGTGDPLVDAAIEYGDYLDSLSEAKAAESGQIVDYGRDLDAKGDPVGPLRWEETTGGEKRGGTLAVDVANTRVAISVHNHHPTGNRRFDHINRKPSRDHDRVAARKFGGRWIIVRGTDGRVTGLRLCSGCGLFGIDTIEEKQFRVPTE